MFRKKKLKGNKLQRLNIMLNILLLKYSLHVKEKYLIQKQAILKNVIKIVKQNNRDKQNILFILEDIQIVFLNSKLYLLTQKGSIRLI